MDKKIRRKIAFGGMPKKKDLIDFSNPSTIEGMLPPSVLRERLLNEAMIQARKNTSIGKSALHNQQPPYEHEIVGLLRSLKIEIEIIREIDIKVMKENYYTLNKNLFRMVGIVASAQLLYIALKIFGVIN